MILLTLASGNRIEIDADEIEDVEPTSGGAFVHCRTGPALAVMQNAGTLQARINAAIAAKHIRTERPEEAYPTAAGAGPVKNDAIARKRAPSFGHETKRLLLARGSSRAIVIGEAGRLQTA